MNGNVITTPDESPVIKVEPTDNKNEVVVVVVDNCSWCKENQLEINSLLKQIDGLQRRINEIKQDMSCCAHEPPTPAAAVQKGATTDKSKSEPQPEPLPASVITLTPIKIEKTLQSSSSASAPPRTARTNNSNSSSKGHHRSDRSSNNKKPQAQVKDLKPAVSKTTDKKEEDVVEKYEVISETDDSDDDDHYNHNNHGADAPGPSTSGTVVNLHRKTTTTRPKPSSSTKSSFTFQCAKEFHCSASFRGLEEMRKHLIQAHSWDKYVPVCNTCGLVCMTSKSKVKHIRTEHGIPCKKCPSRFISYRLYTNHMKNEHHQLNPSVRLSCPECGERFERRGGLISHIKSQHGLTSRSDPNKKLLWPCHVSGCDWASLSIQERDAHARKAHPHTCKICKASFLHFASIRHHCIAKHGIDPGTESTSSALNRGLLAIGTKKGSRSKRDRIRAWKRVTTQVQTRYFSGPKVGQLRS